jgi:hypothetical protein
MGRGYVSVGAGRVEGCDALCVCPRYGGTVGLWAIASGAQRLRRSYTLKPSLLYGQLFGGLLCIVKAGFQIAFTRFV